MKPAQHRVITHDGPLVSVIMPAFNSQDFIGPAIESILEQTHGNLELIVVDDSGDEQCRTIVEHYADERLIYMRGAGGGLSAALNWGVARARGEFIARMDADDIARPDRLETQLEFMRRTKAQLCGSWVQLIGHGARIVKFPEDHADVMVALLFMCPLAHPTVLGEARLFKDNPYDAAWKTSEDYELWSRLARSGVRFGNVPEPLLRYRLHATQATTTRLDRVLSDSEAVAAKVSRSCLRCVQVELFSGLSYGLRGRYSIDEACSLADFAVEVVTEKRASRTLLALLLPMFFRKVHPMRPRVFSAYFSVARKAGVPLTNAESTNLLVQSLLFAGRNDGLFRLARKFWRR